MFERFPPFLPSQLLGRLFLIGLPSLSDAAAGLLTWKAVSFSLVPHIQSISHLSSSDFHSSHFSQPFLPPFPFLLSLVV